MLLDRTEASFAEIRAAESWQNQLMAQPHNAPLLALMRAIDEECWHPGLSLVADPQAACLYAYFLPLEGLDRHPMDHYWRFEPQLDLLPEAAEELAAQVLAEIEADSVRIMDEQGGDGASAQDSRPIAFPLSRQHADLTAEELGDQRLTELACWPRLLPCIAGLGAELTIGMAVLAVSPDGVQINLRLVTNQMPEHYRHVTAEAAAEACVRQANERLRKETLGEPLLEVAATAGDGDSGVGLVHRLTRRHSDRMLAGLALMQPAVWCPDLLARLPGQSLVAVCPSLDCLAVCSPHDHAATAQLSLAFLTAFNDQACRASRLLSRPVRYDASRGRWSFYTPDSAKQEFPVPTTRAQLEEYLACLTARQLELSYRAGVTSRAALVRERCHACGKAAESAPASKLMACTGCGGRRLYCDRRCQRAHWRLHKLECGK